MTSSGDTDVCLWVLPDHHQQRQPHKWHRLCAPSVLSHLAPGRLHWTSQADHCSPQGPLPRTDPWQVWMLNLSEVSVVSIRNQLANLNSKVICFSKGIGQFTEFLRKSGPPTASATQPKQCLRAHSRVHHLPSQGQPGPWDHSLQRL